MNIFEKNNIIFFGEYPQTLKKDNVTVSSTPDNDGYYKGSDGERYAKIVATPYSDSYFFNDKKTKIVSGTTYYFKVEPIKWMIKSKIGEEYKLISILILDCQMYYSSIDERIIDEQTIYANNYENSDIRKWLNYDFLNKAFSITLQSYINTTVVDNGLSSTGASKNPYICNNTKDKIYLPSYIEMLNESFGDSIDYIDNRDSKIKKRLTDYAKAKGCYMFIYSSYHKYCDDGIYWLRSPNYDNNKTALSVNYYGSVSGTTVNSMSYGVVPALSIVSNHKCEERMQSDFIVGNESTHNIKESKHNECALCCKTSENEKIIVLGDNYIHGKCSICRNFKGLELKKGYMYFGEYPQTLKEDNITVSSIPDNDGYYKGSDGERYAKLVATPYKYQIQYFNNSSRIVKGETYYFKIEPIKWKIEEQNNGIYKLISNLIIDNQKYYSSSDSRTIDEQKIYENNYEYSDIRNWLNNDFLNKAFSTTLQSYINTIIVDNSLLSTGNASNPYVCNNTSDKVYLPSYSEITNTMYGYMRYERFDQAKGKKLTDYAKAKGCNMFGDSRNPEYYNNGSYWLRSPYFNFGGCVRYVGSIGDIDSNTGFVNGPSIGVAPALTLTIK